MEVDDGRIHNCFSISGHNSRVELSRVVTIVWPSNYNSRDDSRPNLKENM